jgi:hypothetical protein
LSVEDLHLELHAIFELHFASIGRVKDRADFVAMVLVVCAETSFALVGDEVRQAKLGSAREIVPQQIGSIRVQAVGEILPGLRVTVSHHFSGPLFDGAGGDGLGMQSDFRE